VAITVYQYPKCSTCRTALKWLDKQGIAHDKVDIVTSPPSKAELEKVAKVVGVRRMFNTSGESYRNGNFKAKLETMSDADAIAALARDGKLIKRPFVVHEGGVLTGFDEAAFEAALL